MKYAEDQKGTTLGRWWHWFLERCIRTEQKVCHVTLNQATAAANKFFKYIQVSEHDQNKLLFIKTHLPQQTETLRNFQIMK